LKKGGLIFCLFQAFPAFGHRWRMKSRSAARAFFSHHVISCSTFCIRDLSAFDDAVISDGKRVKLLRMHYFHQPSLVICFAKKAEFEGNPFVVGRRPVITLFRW
jgi:hypothetical protein